MLRSNSIEMGVVDPPTFLRSFIAVGLAVIVVVAPAFKPGVM